MPEFYHAFPLTLQKNNVVDKLLEKNSSETVCVATGTPLQELGSQMFSVPKMTNTLFSKLPNFFDVCCKKEQVCLAMNAKLPNQWPIKKILRSLQPWYKLGSDFDLQRAYMFEQKGLNELLFDIRSDKSWTTIQLTVGGLALLNVNLGPGIIEWVLIPQSEQAKLKESLRAELPQEDRNKKIINLFGYHLSKDWLEKNGITHEVHIQEKHGVIFIPGGVMHQSRSLGHTVSFRYSLLPFNFSALITAINYDKFCGRAVKRPSNVPIARVVHTLILTERDQFSTDEMVILSAYLLEITSDIEQACEKNREATSETIGLVSREDTFVLEDDKCDICTRSLFYQYYRIFKAGSRSTTCVFCLNLESMLYAQHVQQIDHNSNLCNYLQSMIEDNFANAQAFDDRVIWELRPIRYEKLSRLDTRDSNKEILESLRINSKTAHMRRQLDGQTQELNNLYDEFYAANTENEANMLLVVINRTLASIERLENFFSR